MRRTLCVSILALWFLAGAISQDVAAQSASLSSEASQRFSGDEISGMYSFTRDGEFVQISVSEDGAVTGFVSRFGDLESDRGVFLDQFFKTASLNQDKLRFTTQKVHNAWFEFEGRIARGAAKERSRDGYYVIRGTLTQFSVDASKRIASRSRELEMKLFPSSENPEKVRPD
jgi:hypothetical protein